MSTSAAAAAAPTTTALLPSPPPGFPDKTAKQKVFEYVQRTFPAVHPGACIRVQHWRSGGADHMPLFAGCLVIRGIFDQAIETPRVSYFSTKRDVEAYLFDQALKRLQRNGENDVAPRRPTCSAPQPPTPTIHEVSPAAPALPLPQRRPFMHALVSLFVCYDSSGVLGVTEDVFRDICRRVSAAVEGTTPLAAAFDVFVFAAEDDPLAPRVRQTCESLAARPNCSASVIALARKCSFLCAASAYVAARNPRLLPGHRVIFVHPNAAASAAASFGASAVLGMGTVSPADTAEAVFTILAPL